MQRIGFIVLPGFQMMSVASLSVFELANSEIGEPVYDLRLLSETGGSVRSSMGFSVATEPLSKANFRYTDGRREHRGRVVDPRRN
jgi:transcriptional regulator GlxA family with amidase domain